MYSYLSFDNARTEAPWTAHYFALPGVGQTTDPKLVKAREFGATFTVGQACPGWSAPEKAAMSGKVLGVVKHLPADVVKCSFELHMALAHCRLADGERTAREQRIASQLDPHFSDLHMPSLTEHLQQLKAVAVLVPDEAMDVVLRTRVYFTHDSLLKSGAGKTYAQITGVLNAACRTFGETAPALKNAVYAGYFSRPKQDQMAFVDLIQQLPEDTLHRLLSRLVPNLLAREPLLMEADQGDVLLGAMRAWVALDTPTADDSALDALVAIEVERFVARRAGRCSQLVASTLAAMERGVVFDTDSTSRNLAALHLFNQLRAQAERSITVASLRESWAKPTPLVARQPETAPPDLDPVHAWSIDRLLRWIEGPITGLDAPLKALDTTRIVAQEKQARQQQPSAPEKGAKSVEPDWSESDVQLAVRRGLCATAQFFLDEIGDLLRLGQRLQMDASLLTPCEQQQEALRHLIQDGAADVDGAQALLRAVEVAVNRLRQGAHSEQGHQLTRQQFATALDQLLRREPLVRGKRHGGVIAAPLPVSDWGWAVQRFHRRWLPNCTQLEINGVKVTLPADEALGLYVTASSLSDHAFDISVHLWRRRAGRTSVAGRQTEHLAPMNEDDWSDSYLSCAVLHVKPAR